MNLKKQLFLLYGYDILTSFGLTHIIWVLLLVGRGFSLVQVGIAEGVFHLVSFLCEVPSGMCADLLGRKRTMVASRLLSACSCISMVLLDHFAGVCIALSLSALSYNLASGTREALTYDSLVQAGQQHRYEAISARQAAAWRGASAASALLTGVALLVGWRAANLIDAGIALCAAALALGLQEPTVTEAQALRNQHAFANFGARLCRHVADSVGFLWHNKHACAKMLAEGALACGAYLTSMMLQQYYVELGLPAAMVGVPILLSSLAGVAGAALAPRTKLPIRRLLVLGGVCMGGCLVLCGVPLLAVVIAAGCGAAATEALLDIKVCANLNLGFPSDQRATLVSAQSLCYSTLMLPASPLVGKLCDVLGIGAGLAVLGGGLMVGILGCGIWYAKATAHQNAVK